MNFKHKIVNDLDWVIGSVPLMSYTPRHNHYQKLDESWFKEESLRCNAFLKSLDNSPSVLEEFVNQEGKQLLGKRFEKFIEFWLRFSGRFEVLIANEQIKSNGRTLGEIDFLVKELDSGLTQHFEVACKYYLSSANAPVWSSWVGLNARDTLMDKMTKFDKQLSIFQLDEGKELLQQRRIKSPESFLLMKGYFFYHWKDIKGAKIPKSANKNHNVGIYIKVNECAEFFRGWNSWKVLKKENWFSPYVTSDLNDLDSEVSITSEVQRLIAEYNSSVMLARMVEKNGVYIEDLRVIVTPKSWPNL